MGSLQAAMFLRHLWHENYLRGLLLWGPTRENLLVHDLMTAMLTSMIALLMSFIAATDHPYRGTNAIEPVAYKIVLHDVAEYE